MAKAIGLGLRRKAKTHFLISWHSHPNWSISKKSHNAKTKINTVMIGILALSERKFKIIKIIYSGTTFFSALFFKKSI